jgi:hypothetical protein
MRTDAINWFAFSELCRSLQDGGKTPLTLRRGHDAIKGMVQRAHAAFPDYHEDPEEMIAEGDKVVVRLTITGTQLGQWGPLPPQPAEQGTRTLRAARVARPSCAILKRGGLQEMRGRPCQKTKPYDLSSPSMMPSWNWSAPRKMHQTPVL